jgi:hypothetical protein
MDNNISYTNAKLYIILIRGTYIKFSLVVRLSNTALYLYKVNARWRKLAKGLLLARVDSSIKVQGL